MQKVHLLLVLVPSDKLLVKYKKDKIKSASSFNFNSPQNRKTRHASTFCPWRHNKCNKMLTRYEKETLIFSVF